MSDTNLHGEMEEVFQEFISESREMLEEVEPSLIELESHRGANDEAYAEIIASIFRVFHSLKGSAGFLQLDVIVHVTHRAETLLDLIRKGKIELLPDHTDLLCRCCDLIRLMLDTVEEGRSDAEHAEAGGTMEAELRQAIDLAKSGHATGSRPEQETGAGHAVAKRASKKRRTGDRVDIRLQIEQLNDLAGQVDKDDLSKLARMHGLCEAIAEGAAPEDAGDPSSACERARGASRTLASLILGESDDPEGSLASVVAMVSELSSAREGEGPATGEQESPKVRPADPGTAAAEEPTFATGADTVEQFAQESDDALKIVEQRLLDLEKNPTDRAALDEARRHMHSFKGNCGLCGYTDMERLSHRSEEVLRALLDGSGSWDGDAVSVLLGIVDVLQKAIGNLTDASDGGIENCDVMLNLMAELAPARQCAKHKTSKGSPTTDLQSATGDRKGADATVSVGRTGRWAATANDSRMAASADRRAAKRRDIRVDLDKLDQLINLVGELVIAETLVTHNPDLEGYEFESFEKAALHLNKIARDLQDVALSARMIPVSGVFRKMIRLVRDLSVKMDKKVELELVGEGTEVDKTVAELLADPLVHIIRNSVDHGIETPRQRTALGKEETGHVRLEAKHEGGEVWIVIQDDGAGLDREKIVAKARSNGIITDDGAGLSNKEVFRLIFEPGFSTAAKVTDVSGRGVGLDVVKKNIEQLKGRVEVFSKPGEGSTFILRIPLTLAIIDGMLIRVGRSRYTIPILAIRESFRPSKDDITVTMDGTEVVSIRGELLPVVRIHELHNRRPDHHALHDGLLVVVEGHREAICLFVDELIGQQQTVIKGLSKFIGNVPGVSGCAILGNGDVSLILDIAGLVERVRQHVQEVDVECVRDAPAHCSQSSGARSDIEQLSTDGELSAEAEQLKEVVCEG